MENEIKVLDEALRPYGLMCYSSGCSGQKLQFIKVQSSYEADGNNDFRLTLNWHGELIIEDFHGIMSVTTFCELLEVLRLKIIELKL